MKTLQQYLTYVSEQMGINPPSSYSGRSMHGKSCVSVSSSMSECMSLISEVIKLATTEVIDYTFDIDDDEPKDYALLTTLRNQLDQLISTLLDFSQDSMGRGIVIYWEDEEWAANDKDDSDEY